MLCGSRLISKLAKLHPDDAQMDLLDVVRYAPQTQLPRLLSMDWPL